MHWKSCCGSKCWINMFFFFFRIHGSDGPLRLTTPLHFSLSDASWTASGSEHLHQSVTSSDHFLAGRPRGQLPSTTPSITIFASRWSFILQMCPNSCNFFCFTTSTIVQWLHTLSRAVLLPVATSHFEYQEFSGVCGIYCPCFGSIQQMRKDTCHQQINLGSDGQLATAPEHL